CIDLKNKINISTLNDGVYFVKIMIDGKEKIEKLIINEK
ncbi:MAG: T9SS type A sorting domain-containing protein, partial [Bacteroidetes bacterium]|nr:T9SS type A sorting domain-containing protein [Bacteroidota bacterium]